MHERNSLQVAVRCLLVAVSLLSVARAGSTCADIDPQACAAMEANNPGLCSDPTLSTTVCPKHCKLCPLTCYHCDGPTTSTDRCETTKLCADGELCMRLEIRSSSDSHAEYSYKCASKMACDGKDMMTLFGKRRASARDISVHCCSDDNCNSLLATMPPTTLPTTTRPTTRAPSSGCASDLLIVLDTSVSARAYLGDMKKFLVDVLSQVDIGPSNTLVSMVNCGYHRELRTSWELDRYPSKQHLLAAVNGIHTGHYWCNTATAIDYIHTMKQRAIAYNRAAVPDKLLIVSHGGLATTWRGQDTLHGHSFDKDLIDLHRSIQDIILVAVDNNITSTEAERVTTDHAHTFLVHEEEQFQRDVDAVAALIC